MKNGCSGCVLLVIADGFEEEETITILCTLRHAGLCVKSLGLTSGLVNGRHGIWLLPDLTLADIDELTKVMSMSVAILPEGGQVLSKLEVDPRLHRLLRQVVAQGGQVVGSPEARRVLKLASEGLGESNTGFPQMSMFLREPGQSPGDFAHGLIHRLEQAHRT